MKTFSDEELIAHLRLQGLDKDVAAADRIEQLSAQLKMVLEREAETHRRHEAREDTTREAALREAEALAEAKLANAVEALRQIRAGAKFGPAWCIAAVLAELEAGE